MHVPTTVEEMKKLFGPLVDEAIKVDVPGMEIGTQNKYALDLLLDFRQNSPMRPETAAAFQKKLAGSEEAGATRRYVPGAGIVAEPSATSARLPRPASGRERPVTRAISPGMVMPAPARNARAISRRASSRETRRRSASGKRESPSVQM